MAKAPYGSWKSPISTDLIVAGSIGLSSPQTLQNGRCWIESRPHEGGRSVLVKQDPDGRVHDITPAPFNIRTRVHEYGGGASLIHGDSIYFSNFSDQQLYRQGWEDPVPTQLTHAEGYRFANGSVDTRRKRMIYVVEDHNVSGEPQNLIGAVDLETGELTILAKGHDFYSSPVISPDGSRMAFMTWDHPNMPWDESTIWVTELDEAGMPGEMIPVAGGKQGEQKISVQQPQFSATGELFYVSDESGYWNLYREHSGQSVCPREAEFGGPHWVFGMHHYEFLDSGKIICCYSEKNLDQLALLNPETGELEDLDLPYTSIGNLSLSGNRLLTVASSPTLFSEIIEIELSTKTIQTIKTSTDLELDQAYLSVPETIEFPTAENAVAHGFYYPPTNQDFQGLDGETPPLIVMLHGGPTSATHAVLSFKTQYWTTRGFGVLDLNYRGSTGYGRAYQDELIRQWGIIDVEDAVAGAEYLVRQQKADPLRLAIRGGSAGGYTTLAALTFADTFKAGASLYGISDLEILAQETHKFESRYLDQLIGDYPEEKEVYQARSPINHLDQLSSPCIFFHGLEDQVVPPNQAEMMVEALRTKGIPVAYVPFEKEQHGFRIAENIKRCLELELYFYARIFGFHPADLIDPIVIDNLEE
jgi:dipeptidyl aminopeptidase/acylaminoacyl peptidase